MMATVLGLRRPCCGVALRADTDRLELGQHFYVDCKCYPEGREVVVIARDDGLLEMDWREPGGRVESARVPSGGGRRRADVRPGRGRRPQ